MSDENKPVRALSIEEGVLALQQSRIKDQATEAKPEETTEPKPEEVQEDQPEADEAEESQPEGEETADDSEGDEPEDDDADEGDLYEVAGEQFTLAELREWKANGLRQSDYTKKTQEISEARKAFETERQQWDAERESVIDQVTQQKAQLKEALATFAIEQDPEPSPEGLTWDEYTKRKSAWRRGTASGRSVSDLCAISAP